MTMASGMFLVTFIDMLDATQLAVDLSLDSHKQALVLDAYTPNFSTHDFYADITNEVANGGGYTTGGKAITGLSPTLTESPTGTVKYTHSAIAWTSATITARGMVEYLDALTNDPLFAAWTFGSDIVSTAGTFTVTPHANGLVAWDITP